MDTSEIVLEENENDSIRQKIDAASSIVMLMNGTGTVEQAEAYAAYSGMDARNTEAMKIFVTQGSAAGFKHMVINPDTGEPWTYAESRSMYG